MCVIHNYYQQLLLVKKAGPFYVTDLYVTRGGREGGREGGTRAKSPIRPPSLRNITSSNVER